MLPFLGSAAITSVGVLATMIGSLLATTHEGTGLAPFITGGGSAAAVGGLVYMARKIVNGELIPAPVAEYEKRQREFLERCEKREEQLIQVIDQVNQQRAESAETMHLLRETIGEQSKLFYQMIVHFSEGRK